jgi:hypothetical protein
VEIRAEPSAVFAVISDLRRKALFNPNIQVIRVELEGNEPIGEGSVFYHRFQKGPRIVEYRSRCVRFAPPNLFESRSETDPPFEVRVTIEPTLFGCRLTQQESVALTPAMLDVLDPARTKEPIFRRILELLLLFPVGRPLETHLRGIQRERILKTLTDELRSWLEAIRAHLETESQEV